MTENSPLKSIDIFVCGNLMDGIKPTQQQVQLRQVDRFDKTEPAYSISVEGLGIDFEKE